MTKQSVKPFWKSKKTGELTYASLKFIKEFLIPLGFKYTKEGNIVKTTHINQTVYNVDSPQSLQDYVTNFLDNTSADKFESGEYKVLDRNGEPWEKDEVLNLWLDKGKSLCNTTFENKLMLNEFSIRNIFRDTENECFLSFKNGIVKITKDDIQLLTDEKEIGKKFRLTTQFVHRLESHHDNTNWNGSVEINNKEDGEWKTFIKCSTSVRTNTVKKSNLPKYGVDYVYNENGFKSLMSSIGYLLHGKSLGSSNKMVIFQDRYIDGVTRQGGNGKSLVSLGIRRIVKLYESEGIKINPSDRFKYQGINLGDRIFFIDELRPKNGPIKGGIQIHDLFTDITGSFKVQKKNKDEITFGGDDIPKLLGCSNFIVFDKDDASTMRRIHVVEFSDIGKYYKGKIQEMWGSKKRLLGSEGHWTQEDWNDFFNFHFRCIQLYLTTKPDLIEEENQHWKTSVSRGRLNDKYGVEEVDWCLNYLEKTRILKKHYILHPSSTKSNSNTCFDFELHNDLRSSVSTTMNVANMKKMLFDVCSKYGYEYNPTQKNIGNTANARKIQRTYFLNGKGQGQKHVIHITHKNDPSQ